MAGDRADRQLEATRLGSDEHSLVVLQTVALLEGKLKPRRWFPSLKMFHFAGAEQHVAEGIRIAHVGQLRTLRHRHNHPRRAGRSPPRLHHRLHVPAKADATPELLRDSGEGKADPAIE